MKVLSPGASVHVVGPHKSGGEAQLSSFLHGVSVLANGIFREHSLPWGPCPGKAVRGPCQIPLA